MSGYTRLPTYNPDNSKYDSDADVSREISDQEDCASFAENEDNQNAPLLGMFIIQYFLIWKNEYNNSFLMSPLISNH